VNFAEPPSPSTVSFPHRAVAIAERYSRLESDLREAIDAVATTVCAACEAPCCRVHYCRETARNPWYRFVNQVAGRFRVPADWETRRDAFGLGPRGCDIRSGRYVFCYSFNCRRLLAAVETGEREGFQALSDLLLTVNRLPRGRLLHELRRADDLDAEDLGAVNRALRHARRRLQRLRRRVFLVDRTSQTHPLQANGRRVP
jgi:hypothetical protein